MVQLIRHRAQGPVWLGAQVTTCGRGLVGGLLAHAAPSLVALDLLQHDGQELLTRPYAERRALLENLFTEHALTAPWALVPQTTDLAKAREWLQSWTDVSGVEGILIKPLNSRYLPGYRGWTKIRNGMNCIDCNNSTQLRQAVRAGRRGVLHQGEPGGSGR
ncbi:ATP-dependent DNA ligase [Streptomyces erythrochromogenes]|uniref:ATP-dependent DNA ligase n=1 Tax=Streptomyces erythrochromogenes TaxID=285574 RepID=UPI0037029841